MIALSPELAEALDPARIEAYRLRLRRAGFSPVPVSGKAAYLPGWQRLGDVTEFEIKGWTKTRPVETNTGILTRLCPALDIDTLDPEAAEQMARERYEDHGVFPVRFGKPPKRAVMFRTDLPFKKYYIDLAGPLDAEKAEKIELLGDGEQIVCDGIHPDTGLPYSWHGGRPGEFKRGDRRGAGASACR
jgi:hypothetical protein